MVSAVFSGLAYTAVIKLKKTDQPITIVLYFPMVAIPLMTILCFWKFTWPQGIEWIILLVIGIFTQFAQIMLTKALHLGSAATITPFQYLGAIYMFLIGYFVFDERLGESVDGKVISNCHLCGEKSDTHTNCANDDCHQLMIQCEDCKQKYDGCCGEECQSIFHMPKEEQLKYRKLKHNHYSKSKIYNRIGDLQDACQI